MNDPTLERIANSLDLIAYLLAYKFDYEGNLPDMAKSAREVTRLTDGGHGIFHHRSSSSSESHSSSSSESKHVNPFLRKESGHAPKSSRAGNNRED